MTHHSAALSLITTLKTVIVQAVRFTVHCAMPLMK